MADGHCRMDVLTVSQYILGVRPAYDGLELCPCLPAEMKGYTVTRRFRDAEYEICVENPNGKQCGVSAITLDGQTVEGNRIPYSAGKHQVKVVM